MAWAGRPSLPALHIWQASEATAILTQIEQLTDPGWTDYSSTLAWTASGTAPAFGNAVKVAQWRRPTDCDLIHVQGKVTYGTTSTYGTGTHFYNLPVAAASSQISMAGGGGAFCLDSGVQEYLAGVKIESSTTFRMPIGGGSAAGSVGQTVPHTWGSTDIVSWNFFYVPA